MGLSFEDTLVLAALNNGLTFLSLAVRSDGQWQASGRFEGDEPGSYRVNIGPSIAEAVKPLLDNRSLWRLETKIMELTTELEKWHGRLATEIKASTARVQRPG